MLIGPKMLFLSFTICFAASGLTHAKLESYIFPFTVANHSVSYITTKVGSRPLDTAYITSPNSTSYEWWYFDAVASDLSASIVLQSVVENESFLLVLDFSYANGTGAIYELPCEKSYFSTNGDGSKFFDHLRYKEKISIIQFINIFSKRLFLIIF